MEALRSAVLAVVELLVPNAAQRTKLLAGEVSVQLTGRVPGVEHLEGHLFGMPPIPYVTRSAGNIPTPKSHSNFAGLADSFSTRSQLRAGLARCVAAVPPDVLDAHATGAEPSRTVGSPHRRRNLSACNCTGSLTPCVAHSAGPWPAYCCHGCRLRDRGRRITAWCHQRSQRWSKPCCCIRCAHVSSCCSCHALCADHLPGTCRGQPKSPVGNPSRLLILSSSCKRMWRWRCGRPASPGPASCLPPASWPLWPLRRCCGPPHPWAS